MENNWLRGNKVQDTFVFAVGLELKFNEKQEFTQRTSDVEIFTSGTQGHWNFKPSWKHKLILIWRVLWS